MQEQYSTYHSENLVFIGAGSTSSLGIPTTSTQSKFFRKFDFFTAIFPPRFQFKGTIPLIENMDIIS